MPKPKQTDGIEISSQKDIAIARPNFDEEYAKLNEAQRRAVDAIEGPVMVIAGPGT